MTATVLIRCLCVSLAVAILATPLSMAVYEKSEVPDLSKLDLDRMSEMSDEEREEYWGSIPYREIEGLERFTYPFTHPQIGYFYLVGVIQWFLGLLVATVLVSILNAKVAAKGERPEDQGDGCDSR